MAHPSTRRRAHAMKAWPLAALGLCACLCATPAHAAQLHVAVASNFATTLQAIATSYEDRTAHRVVLVAGSTGKLTAQIIQGAPFDAFFAADAERPRRLEEEKRIVPGSRFAYASGTLVLWSADSKRVDGSPRALEEEFRWLAIANPRLAPYGRAGLQVLDALGMRTRVEGRLVFGENVAQAFQFVSTGNAALGFVALSQVLDPRVENRGSMWVVPDSLHAPIEQHAVLLRDTEVGRAFLAHCRSEEALRILRRAGYDVP